MKFSVVTDDVRGISTAFGRASSSVSELRATLASQASGPESQDVIGSADAAAGYTRTLQAWMHSLDQLATSLEIMARKLTNVASHYEATECGNTVHADSVPGTR